MCMSLKVLCSSVMLSLQIIIILGTHQLLHVGHTHADCDQFFSKISQHILKYGSEYLGGWWNTHVRTSYI